MCSDVMGAKLWCVSIHGCHGASIIMKDSATFTEATAETAMEVVTNLSEM